MNPERIKRRLKKAARKAFFLPLVPTLLVSVPSYVLVIYALAGEDVDPAIQYAAYFLSAYALVITVTGIAGVVVFVRQGIDKHPLVRKILSIPFVSKYLKEVMFRTETSLYQGFFVNLLYAGIKLFSGILYSSAWFVVLAGIVVLVVYENSGFTYPGVLIYVMAVYAFYATITAVRNVVKFRKYGSPVMSAAKMISLTAALVSMLSLETAMLTQFGAADEPVFRRIMTASTGAGISIIVLGMAVFMIVKASKQMKQIRQGKGDVAYG